MYSKNSCVSPARAVYLKNLRTRRILIYSARILLLVLFIGVWELAGQLGWIDTFVMSQPSRIAKSIADLWRQGDLFMHIGISCLETVIGFVAGTVLGVLLAVGLWWSPAFYRVTEPYLVVLNALPKIALGPVFILWVGAGVPAIVIMALAVSLVVTVMEVLQGFVSTDSSKIMLLRTFGATRWQILTKVVFPSNLPVIISSLKVNVGLSWVGVIVGEYLVSRAGIGYLIVYGGQVFQMDLVMAGVLILAAAAALMYQGILLIEKRLLRRY